MISDLKSTNYNIEAENKVLRELSGESARFMGGNSNLSYEAGSNMTGSNIQTTQFGLNSQYSSTTPYQGENRGSFGADRTQASGMIGNQYAGQVAQQGGQSSQSGA